jgi:hypothetical protein
MRRASLQWRWFFLAITGVLLVLTGCQEMGLPTGLIEPPQSDPAAVDDPADKLTADAQAQAQRIATASAAADAGPPREIVWLNSKPDPQAQTQSGLSPRPEPTPPQATAHRGAMPTTATAEQASTVTPTDPDPLAVMEPDPIGSAAEGRQLNQAQVYQQLLQAVRQSEDSNLSKALTAATLGAIGPHGELDRSLLAPLSPKDQELVKRYHQTVSTLRREVLDGGGKIDQATVTGRLEDLFGSQPITIRKIELCEKVLGYGVYDAFPDQTFMAGREQKLIVYVELDNFLPAKRDQGDGYEVSLRQELELYESNGFEVWSHEPVQIVDVSRNKRRDFFVVQLVTLPAQLGVGQYHLKVRVYDENAGTRDETSIKIQLVADESMVRRSQR